ncbi:MAG: hypothetical protein JO085_03865, partial [Acidimicrobiia bacterium]|nr:hypothetical protein [Acidimicrobiia bacterium]
ELPRLRIDDLDLYLIDGAHGFPTPMIDWFYGARLLRRGGVVVLDDRQLPAVAALIDYLDADPRWRAIDRTGKWAAFERLTDGSLAEEWCDQPFFTQARPRSLSTRALGRLRRTLRRTLRGSLRRRPAT